ncbi:MAG TPA: cytochrome c biogenesis protein CcdA [Gemmatimonadales bacterium]|nr:cytochrome c biogenesis protein CcdA [Gemmatimonadales bacterium]
MPDSAALDAVLQHQPLVALGVLFLAGVATSLTPCIYPMIPITAALLGGNAARERSRARTALLTGCYVLGLALVYAALGLIAGLTGSLFGAISSNRWAYLLFGNLLLLAGLAMLDVIPVQAPRRLLHWAGRLGGGSPGAALLLGATSGLVAAPCGAPAFAAVLTWVASTRSAVWGFIYLFVFSVGMTTLLVVIGLGAGSLNALPRSGQWMIWIKRIGAVIMLAMAQYYLVRAGMVW